MRRISIALFLLTAAGLAIIAWALYGFAGYNADPTGSPTFNGGNVVGLVTGVGFNFIGTPTASQIEAVQMPFTLNIPANYATPTSTCTCGTNPAETDAYTVKCNGASQGTFSLSTSCVLTLPTNSAYACSAGQRLEFDAPATVSGANIACSVLGTR